MILETLVRTLQQQSFIANSPIVLAVSGGTDSLAMLHAFTQLQAKLGCELHVATLNHGLRTTAVEDVRFVQGIAQQWGIPCTAGYVDVPALAQATGKNMEAVAREARYTFLAQVARQVQAHYIATAHHANDQAETILMHILRGTGSAGLQGMAVQTPLPYAPELTLLRPMLALTRTELEDYCQQHGLQPRADETNQDTTLLRNAIRLEILPQLAQINPQIHKSLSRLGDIVRVEHDFMEQQYQRIVAPHITILGTRRILLPRTVFREIHPALQRRWFIEAVRYLRGNTDELSYERIQAALETTAAGSVGAVVQFSHQIQVVIEYENIVVQTADSQAFPAAYLRLSASEPLRVTVPGITDTSDNWQLHTSLSNLSTATTTLYAPPNAALMLRTRQPGDIFAPAGLNGQHQKLKKWLIDHKIPRPIRDHLPLLIINETIAALLLPRWILAEPFIHPRPNWQKINFVIVIKD